MTNYPVAPKQPKEITQHGQTRVDNYFWMRYREDPQVLKYLHAEQDHKAKGRVFGQEGRLGNRLPKPLAGEDHEQQT